MWREIKVQALLAAVLVLAPACAGRKALPLPDLPAIRMENFQPAIREQVEKAYAAAQANPRDAEASGKLGMVLEAYEQNQVAEVCYQRARALDPAAFQWAYYLGAVEVAQAKHAAAVEALRATVRLKPDYLAARVKLAEALFATGDRRESRRIYEALLKENPSLPQAFYGLGRVKEAEGDLAAAIENYGRACELAPNYAVAHYALALASRRQGDGARAEEHLAAYKKDPLAEPRLDDPLHAAVKELNAGAQSHLKAAVGLESAGRLQEAIAECERALEMDPKLTQAQVNLISLYGRTGQPDKAVKHYRAAIELNPSQADAYYNYGVLLYEQNKHREAGDAFRKALEINPYYPEAHNNLAFVLEREGRPDEALKHYRAAIENKPNYRLAHFHLARLLLGRGRNAEAIEHFRQTLTPEDESTPGFLYGLGAAYARAGDRQHALQYIREAQRRAAAYGQTQLLASIERDLRTLEQRP